MSAMHRQMSGTITVAQRFGGQAGRACGDRRPYVMAPPALSAVGAEIESGEAS